MPASSEFTTYARNTTAFQSVSGDNLIYSGALLLLELVVSPLGANSNFMHVTKAGGVPADSMMEFTTFTTDEPFRFGPLYLPDGLQITNMNGFQWVYATWVDFEE